MRNITAERAELDAAQNLNQLLMPPMRPGHLRSQQVAALLPPTGEQRTFYGCTTPRRTSGARIRACDALDQSERRVRRRPPWRTQPC